MDPKSVPIIVLLLATLQESNLKMKPLMIVRFQNETFQFLTFV